MTPPTTPTLSSTIRRRVLGGLMAGLVLAVAPAIAAPSADDARALVAKVGDDVLGVLRDPGLADREKLDRLIEILSGPIDLDLVGRLILGRHWRSASAEQRKEYTTLFHAYALANLASKLHLYAGQSFEVSSATIVNDRDAVVASRIVGTDAPPLQVDWRLRQRKDQTLVAIDMVVEGVSMIVTLRSEFASVIERQGFDGLLAELRQRIDRAA